MAIDMSSKATFAKFGCIGLNFVAFLAILVGTFIPYWYISYDYTDVSPIYATYRGINGNCAVSLRGTTITIKQEPIKGGYMEEHYRTGRDISYKTKKDCEALQVNFEIAIAGVLTVGALVCLLNCLLAAGSMFSADKVLSHCLFLTSFLSAFFIYNGLAIFIEKAPGGSQELFGGSFYGPSFYVVCFAFLLNALGIVAASFASIFRTHIDQQAAGPTGFVQAFAPAATAPPTAPN